MNDNIDSIEKICGVMRMRRNPATARLARSALSDFAKYSDAEMVRFLLHYAAALLAEVES